MATLPETAVASGKYYYLNLLVFLFNHPLPPLHSFQVRNGVRVRRQNTDDRMRTGRPDQSDTRQLRPLLDHHLQRPWERRLERQLYVGQEPARAAHQVSVINIPIHIYDTLVRGRPFRRKHRVHLSGLLALFFTALSPSLCL